MNGKLALRHEDSRKLLFVVNAVWFFLSHRLPIAVAAKSRGLQVHVAGDYENQAEIDELTRQGIVFHHIRLKRGPGAPLQDARLFFNLWSLYRRLDPAIVHHVTSKPIIVGGIAAKLVGQLRIVNAISGLGYAYSSSDLRARLLRWPMQIAYRMALSGRHSYQIFQNASDRDLLLGHKSRSRKSFHIAGSGVDLQRFSDIPDPEPVPIVLLPARMLRDKGVVEFCFAAREVKRRIPNVRFVLAGRLDPQNPAGLGETELDELCRTTGAEWIGEQSDMVQLLGRAAVVCLPSYREGLPKSLIEACAAGRPIIASDVPGCRDVVSDGVNGLLVPARNVSALAGAMQTLLADANLRQAMGKRGRAKAEAEFDVRDVVAKTLEIYEVALSRE